MNQPEPYTLPPIPYIGEFAEISAANFGMNGRKLNNRKLWKRMKRNSAHTSPKKSKRAKAFKGFRRGQ